MSALTEPQRQSTISLYVRDKPGVLVRIGLVFARRGYNIESLVVNPGAKGGFSRMTITCTGEKQILDQIISQLEKLVDVVHAIDHTGDEHYETEIGLIKLVAPLDRRTEILQIAEQYGVKVVDYGPDSLILRVYGSSGKIDSLLEILRRYEVVELVRSGKILMSRGRATT
jgi:acetolactate synthase-1/3 small subunit